ncbi:MAG: bidirectional hydrogenase complex protein HoxE [Desulfofustis sp.]|jgi:bidirectional [NiFe] hydrogenase diaphorase subunit|nr:bidirectional hydrogenase complex protein HoxE [Desulfofustis sp.]
MATTSKHKNAPAEHEAVHTDPRYKLVDRTLKRFRYQQDALIEVLHTAQEAFGFLNDELMVYIARELKLPQSWVYGVATFYHFFSLEPQGEHTCVVCMGTACYVKRSAEIVARIQNEYSIKPGETTADGKLSLATARCLGSCGLAPVLVVDDEVLGKETPESTLQKIREAIASSPDSNGEIADSVNPQEQEERAS